MLWEVSRGYMQCVVKGISGVQAGCCGRDLENIGCVLLKVSHEYRQCVVKDISGV